MLSIVALALSVLPISAQGQSHQFVSTVKGITILNAHSVDRSGNTFRGSQPLDKVAELARFGITDVLIVKNQNHDEVDEEVDALNRMGVRTRIIPIDWKSPNLQKTCLQVIEAVQALQQSKLKNRQTYFHCTSGEDRTGTIAGLFRMLDQGWDAKTAFRQEMCLHGFSDADPEKPDHVVSLIEKNLTPVFMALSTQIEQTGKIDARACASIFRPASVLTCH